MSGINHGIYERRYASGTPSYTDLPHCIYFYYVRIDSSGKILVSHYFYPGGDPSDPANPADPHSWMPIAYDEHDPGVLKALVRQLAINARGQNGTPGGTPPSLGENFKDIVWRRKSYVAIFVDEANWKLHKFADADPSILFITEPKGGLAGEANHSFFDAIDLDINMPIAGSTATDTRSAVVFINHMKADEAGADLQAGDAQHYQFKMFLDVTFASGTSGMTVIFDPDGTNLGPPLGPP